MSLDKFYRYCYGVIKHQKAVYLTKQTYSKILAKSPNPKASRAIFKGIDDVVGSDNVIVTCEILARDIKITIRNCQKQIREIQSKSSTNRIAYADLLKVPGSDNYQQIFHYHHRLSPSDKEKIRRAQKLMIKCQRTCRSNPDTSPNAPIYDLRNGSKPWTYQLIFKDRLLKRIQKLRKTDTLWKRAKLHWKWGKHYHEIYENE